MDNKKATSPELLCPARDMDALISAVSSGADAVYFGTDLFNARIRATNFNLDSVRDAVKICHAHNVKAFVTLNIAIYQREIPKLLEYVSALYESGVDALIVSDLGIISLIRRLFPDFEIHASTQAVAHNLDAVKLLKEMGCSRAVVARELDKKSIKEICQGAGIEIEIFVHGAHCMSVSGGCLMSYAMGGRSGNRGECAQPCRLPYKIGNKSGYFLSLKDMCLASHIDEIIDTGASSLKIEGRMKSADYVGGVTSVYRELLDSKRNASDKDLQHLKDLFSRQGFTDGYFEAKIGDNMMGIRSEDDKETTKSQQTTQRTLEKPRLDMSARLILGQRATLTVSDGHKTATVYGDVVESAISQPMSREDIAKNLVKLGSTPYTLGELDIEKSDGIMLRVSSLNALRRSAIDKLLIGEREHKSIEYTPQKSTPVGTKSRSAVFSRVSQIPENCSYFDRAYVYVDRYEKSDKINGIYLPPVILDSEWQEIERKMKQARENGVQYALISNIGQIERAKKHGFTLVADFRFNAFNTETTTLLHSMGVEQIILSPELSLPQAMDMRGESIIVYGKIPVMTTHKCIIKSTEGCEKCSAVLSDRTGANMYCEGIFGHRNIIYNSVPIYMADKREKINDFSWHFIFSSESRAECEKIIEMYEKGLPTDKRIRRIKA